MQDVSAATQKVQDVLEKDPLSGQILALRQEQDALRRQRKDLSKTLRLAEKKKTRLRKRAKALTDEDLIQVLMMRKEQREYAAPGAAAEAQSGGSTLQAADARLERADSAEQHDDGAGSCALLFTAALGRAAAQVGSALGAAAAVPKLPADLMLPPLIDQHFKFLRAHLHPSFEDPHMDVWKESAFVCQVRRKGGGA